MAYGEYEGARKRSVRSPNVHSRIAAGKQVVYRARLGAKRTVDIACALDPTHGGLDRFVRSGVPDPEIDWECRAAQARETRVRVERETYLAELVGTLGADPSVVCGT
jgi:hypothetical protein